MADIERRSFVSGLAAITAMGGSPSTFRSGVTEVPIDVMPGVAGHGPAVVLLHGRGGMSLYGADFAHRAAALSASGFSVFTPHYFAATASADSPDVTAQSFEAWRRAVADALAFVRSQAFVSPTRVGVLGVSLGGFIASVQGARFADFDALVAESCGLSDYFPVAARRLPPLLIIRSSGDPIVSQSNAEALAARARALGGEANLIVLPGDEHLLTDASARTAFEMETKFLRDKLLWPKAG